MRHALSRWSAPALAGLVWTLLCAVLWRDGHQPHAGPLGVQIQNWYLIQGVITPVLIPLLAWIHTETTARLIPTTTASVHQLTRAYAVALTVALLGPELLAYALGGFALLSAIAPVCGLLVVISAWASAAFVVRRQGDASWPTAITRVLPGLVLQAAVGAMVLR